VTEATEYGVRALSRRYHISPDQARRLIRRFGKDTAKLDAAAEKLKETLAGLRLARRRRHRMPAAAIDELKLATLEATLQATQEVLTAAFPGEPPLEADPLPSMSSKEPQPEQAGP